MDSTNYSIFRWLTALLSVTVCSGVSLDNECQNMTNSDCFYVFDSNSSPSITCRFASVPPQPIFSECAPSIKLTMLDLANNNLSSLPDNFMQGIGDVTMLSLAKNKFSYIPPVLLKFGNLSALNLSDNLFQTIPSGISKLDQLETLDLANNRIDDSSWPNLTTKFANLKHLNLSSNRLATTDPQLFQAMMELRTLDLSSNQLTDINEKMLAPLKSSLVVIDLSHNFISYIQPMAVQHFSHLRVLKLSNNKPLENVNKLEFPQHLRVLELGNCQLTVIDHCQFTCLTDLTNMDLTNNPLQCSCQLFLLYQWYQSQHHEITATSDWPCILPKDISSNLERNNSKPLDNMISQQETLCTGLDIHCPYLEHIVHHQTNSSKIVVELQAVSSKDNVMVSWSVEDNEEVVVDGYRLQYVPEDGETMTSPILPATQRSYTFNPPELENHYSVCLEVLAFGTETVVKTCRLFKDEYTSALGGILAGVIFLIPCVVALIYILARDYRVNKHYEAMETMSEDNSNHVKQENDKILSSIMPPGHGVVVYYVQNDSRISYMNEKTGPLLDTQDEFQSHVSQIHGDKIQYQGREQDCANDENKAEHDRAFEENKAEKASNDYKMKESLKDQGMDNLAFVCNCSGNCGDPQHESTSL